jgi:N-acetylmuramic acid 6-phosphate etherase
MSLEKVTEMPSKHRHLEKMTTKEMLENINIEDQTVALTVKQIIPQIESLVDAIAQAMAQGGRLFYIGAGTSGRLGVLDASECPPTYGVSADLVVGVMAGGDAALRFGIEDIEDIEEQGAADLNAYHLTAKDVVVGLAASGTTPYVIGALKESQRIGATTGCIVCNANSPIEEHADHPIIAVVGPEFVTGSTRMKSGTAQKLILNMISTSVMIKLGRVHDNRMVNMEISNSKLMERGIKMLMEKANITDYIIAKHTLLKYGNVKKAIENYKN